MVLKRKNAQMCLTRNIHRLLHEQVICRRGQKKKQAYLSENKIGFTVPWQGPRKHVS